MSKIAIIGMTSLEVYGIKAVVESQPQLASYEVEIILFPGFGKIGRELEKIDYFVVDANSFALHSDFFIPRKSRTLIVLRNITMSVAPPINEKGISSSNGMKCIFSDSTEEEITEAIGSLLSETNVSPDSSGELSGREKEVLKALASGKTNKEIGDLLSISVNTVITHRKNISSKLGIKSVSGLSLYALMNGII